MRWVTRHGGTGMWRCILLTFGVCCAPGLKRFGILQRRIFVPHAFTCCTPPHHLTVSLSSIFKTHTTCILVPRFARCMYTYGKNEIVICTCGVCCASSMQRSGRGEVLSFSFVNLCTPLLYTASPFLLSEAYGVNDVVILFRYTSFLIPFGAQPDATGVHKFL